MQGKSTDSVISMLMGLDKFQHQQTSSRKHRVLSEDYILNSASICLRSGSLVSSRQSSRTKNEVVHAAKDVSGVQRLKGKNDNAVAQHINSTSTDENEGRRCRNPIDASISSSLLGSRYLDSLAYLSRTECSGLDNARRYLQRIDDDLTEGYLGELDNMNNALKAKLEMVDKRYLSEAKRQSAKAPYDFEDVKLVCGSWYVEQRKSLRKENGKCKSELTYKEPVGTAIASPTIGCATCKQKMYRTSQQEVKKSKFKDLFLFSFHNMNYFKDYNCDPLHSLDQSSLAYDSRRQSHESEETAKGVKGLGVSGREQALDEMHAWDIKKTVSRNFATELVRDVPSILSSVQSRSSGSSSPSICSSIYSSDDAQYTSNDAYTSLVCSRISGEAESESNSGLLMETVDSHLQDVSSREVPLEELSDGGSGYPFCSRLNPPSSQEKLIKANHHCCPDSVLEPLDIQTSNSSIGTSLHPDALNFETEGIFSKGVITGNEDPEEWFDCLSNGSTNLERLLGDDQRRNFSYLVDVLDKAGYCRTEPFIDLTKWHSLGCPLSPFIFEALEETYDKQMSWQKSERRLLFDNINSVLVEIFNPLLNFQACETSAKLSLLASLRRAEIEDKLWTMLSKHEDEKHKELSEKWLVYEQGMDIICRELETSLFDELVIELGSFWDS